MLTETIATVERPSKAGDGSSLSIVVPAYNEERHLATTLAAVIEAAERNLADYEIIVVDDGSGDATGRIADEAARHHTCIRVIHQPVNRGVGAAYSAGLKQARYGSISVVPGDNAFSATALDSVFSSIGLAPLIISYRANVEVRKPLRRMLSVACTTAMRIVTGKQIRDAQSMFIFPVDLARRCETRETGYGYHIETLGRLLVMSPSYLEVPANLNPGPDDNSRVMRPRVLFFQGITMLRLAFWRLRYTLGQAINPVLMVGLSATEERAGLASRR